MLISPTCPYDGSGYLQEPDADNKSRWYRLYVSEGISKENVLSEKHTKAMSQFTYRRSNIWVHVDLDTNEPIFFQPL